jgi:hypothetical protein
MDVLADPQCWAEHHFGAVALGDARRDRRLVRSAAALAQRPEASFPQLFDWNDLRGFYRLCDQPTATLPVLQGPHWQQTRQAMAQHPLVLILHDTTLLDYTAHPALTGAGPIGDGNGRGFLQHNSLALVPGEHRQVLGLAYQQWHVRQPVDKERSSRRKRRPRESAWWADGFRAAGTAPEGCCWVDVADRAGDDYEALRAARQVGHHFLVRAYQDRVVFADAQRQQSMHLLAYARALPAQGTDVVEIAARGGRPARTAEVRLASGELWLPAPAGTPQRWSQPMLQTWVIRIWEPNPPPDAEALEWLLLCSVPTTTLADLKERRDWYSCRWQIEVFHDVEKNGCSEEDRRFETAARLEACVAILAVVAVRVLQLRCALESQPEAPAEQVATAAEIEVLRRWTGSKQKRWTVRMFVRGVARLGGFLGRKGDGEPGVRTLWRGYQRLQDLVLGFQLQNPPDSERPKEPPKCW